jgi:hypothetical protein
MADEENPLSTISPELLREKIKLSEQLLKNTKDTGDALKEISLYDQQRLDSIGEELERIKEAGDIQALIADRKQKILELDNDITTAAGRAKAVAEAQKKLQEVQVENLTKIDNILKSSSDLNALIAAHDDRRVQSALAMVNSKTVERDLEKQLIALRDKPPSSGERDRANLMETVQGAFTGAVQAAPELLDNFKDLGLQTLALSLIFQDLGMDSIAADARAIPKALDDSYREIIRGGFSHSKNMLEVYDAMMDPINAMSKDFGHINEEDLPLFMTNIGLLGPEAAKANKAARGEISLFRRSFVEGSKENYAMYAATTNLIGGLAKLGVAEADTAQSVDFFNRALKESPRTAHESVRRLTNVAHTLDVNVASMFKEFGQVVQDLSQYGDRTVDVFADLKAQSVSTGIDVNNLASMAGKLDTFKGAAQAAQGFNAVLGKTVLSVTDLVHAEPAEKINLLRDAMDRSGMSFENANRRVKSIIASLLGVDVEAASRLFGTKEDFFELKSGMDTSAEGMDQLKKRAEDSMNIAEKARATQQSLVAGSRELITEAYDAADKMALLTLKTFKDIKDKGKSTEQAVLGVIGVLTGAGQVQQTARRTAVGAAKFGLGAMAVDEILKAAGFGGGLAGMGTAAIHSLEKKLSPPQGTTSLRPKFDLDGDGYIGPKSDGYQASAGGTPPGRGMPERDIAQGGGGGAGAFGGTVHVQIPIEISQGGALAVTQLIDRKFTGLTGRKVDPVKIDLPEQALT